MVLGGLGHRFNLLLVEPIMQSFIFANDTSRNEVMRFASLTDAGVMVGSNGVNHVYINIIVFCQLKAAKDDSVDMVALMGGIIMLISRKNLMLNVLDQTIVDGSLHKRWNDVAKVRKMYFFW